MEWVREQYKNINNLGTRIGLYQYSVSPLSLSDWIGTKLPNQGNLKILELGCGTGLLWKSIYKNFPDSEITLTDYSENMIREAQKNLSDYNFSFQKVDYHNIPFGDNSFDLVISNHNLYHAENLDQVLGEIKRVLKPKGMFSCSTNSGNHLIELKNILEDSGIDSLWPNMKLIEQFGMENGENVLKSFFPVVEKHLFENSLHVTDAEVVINYFLSLRDERIRSLIEEKKDDIVNIISTDIHSKGFFEVKALPGMFLCKS